MTSKPELRKEMIARREAIPQGERERIAEALTDELTSLPQYAAARTVMATMSIGSEWSTRAFLEGARADGKVIVLPRVTAAPRHLALHVVHDLERHLVPGVWSIPEPDPDRCPAFERDRLDFVVVPALAADRQGYRLGYGAGYFDRLLDGRGARPYCVTALPAAFIVAALPRDSHDVAVDLVIDERGSVTRRG